MKTKPQFDLLNFVIEGDGPPVILLHGISASLDHWQYLLPELISAGYCALAMDLLGHGDSAKPRDPRLYTMDALYGAFEALLDCLQLDPPFTLVGHSLGGYLSLRYAHRNPRNVRAMVLIDPLYSLKQLTPALGTLMPLNFLGVKILKATPRPVVDTFLSLDETFTMDLAPRIRQMYARDVKRASPYFLLIPASAKDLTPRLKDIPAQTLVIWGAQDRIEYPHSFPRLVSGLPHATGRIIAGGGHQPHHGKPKLVNRIILDFINQSASVSERQPAQGLA